MSKLLMTGTEAIDMWLIKLQIPRFRRIKETNLLGPSQVQFLHDDHCTILLPMFLYIYLHDFYEHCFEFAVDSTVNAFRQGIKQILQRYPIGPNQKFYTKRC